MASFHDVNPYATGAIRELDSLALFCGLNPSGCPSQIYSQTITDRWVLAGMTVGLGGAGMLGRGDDEVGPGEPLAAREQPVAQEDLDKLAAKEDGPSGDGRRGRAGDWEFPRLSGARPRDRCQVLQRPEGHLEFDDVRGAVVC